MGIGSTDNLTPGPNSCGSINIIPAVSKAFWVFQILLVAARTNTSLASIRLMVEIATPETSANLI